MDSVKKMPELFGSMVFNEEVMKERLSKASYKEWKRCVTDGETLDIATANEIAEAMKHWAVEKGATHYTHWFQPMTGATAEKHDSFLNPVGNGRVIMEFSGKELVRGEPDASSFPSGGLRTTFEARGYTAWDPTSSAFVKENSLYIPTIFCSYSGHALDKKTPLLRSMEAVSKASVRILRLFGDEQTKRVIAQVGAEQEYFLIDKKLYRKRKDLMMTGRTLFGARPPRGQEMEDHYFGMIKPRVSAFMQDLDNELWKVGVLSKTKHNEVAPSQHEMAPIYTDANTACDHNQLAMELMKKVANRHGFVCLIHEKPFKYVNGSGKHDNWSLSKDNGENLFKPGSTPDQNAQFLLFLAAFLHGVDEYQDFLRATVAIPGNDYRLGAQEAPPAVMSIFLGDELSDVVNSIIEGVQYREEDRKTLKVGVDVLPAIRKDNTDRNRTSPMAFTGNKFEFRMLGSSQSISGPNIVLNTMMAEALTEYADILEEADDFNEALQKLVRKEFTDHRRILFDGNGYGDEWLREAERRGLSNHPSTADALKVYDSEKNEELLVKYGIYKPEEMEARARIHVDNYIAVKKIEARTMVDMIRRDILPAVSGYSADICDRARTKVDLGLKAVYEKKAALEIEEHIAGLMNCLERLEADLEKVDIEVQGREEGFRIMDFCHEVIEQDMDEARSHADILESLTDEEYWPFPVYSKLLFSERNDYE